MVVYLIFVVVCATHLFLPEGVESVTTSTTTTESTLNDIKSALAEVENCTLTECLKPPTYRWKEVLWPTRAGMLANAVLGGVDFPNLCGKVYVGRAVYQGSLLPAKVCGSDGRAFVSYNGTEVMLNESEVLISRHVLWKPITEGEIPKEAFQVGYTDEGGKLFIGRGFIGTLLTPGVVNAHTRLLSITYDQQVYSTLQYEILILKRL